MLHADLTEQAIGVFFDVYNELGYGFLEKVYENSMLIALRGAGLRVEQQKPIPVFFRGECVGEYFADLVIENKVIIELKSTKAISPSHEAQLLNYLKATQIQVGLLFNFGPEPEFRRKIMTHR